jgi:YD repeat-containing protein
MKTSRRNRQGLISALAFLIAILGGTAAFAANGSVTYTYDALGRVTSASYDTGVIVIYTYDANGNRTQQVINVNTAGLNWAATGTSCATSPPVCWATGLWQ